MSTQRWYPAPQVHGAQGSLRARAPRDRSDRWWSDGGAVGRRARLGPDVRGDLPGAAERWHRCVARWLRGPTGPAGRV